jgi:predicted nucleic acid-binding Zn ribbon protein
MKTMGAIFEELAKKNGVFSEIKVRSILLQWESIIGTVLAKKTKPLTLKNGVLVVLCTDSIWAAELKFYTKDILRKLNEQLRDIRTIRSIKIAYKE